MCVCVCAHSVITTGFGKSGSVHCASCSLQDSQISEGKYFVQTSDCHYAFHTREDVKMIHIVPIVEDVFSVEPNNGAQHQSSN